MSLCFRRFALVFLALVVAPLAAPAQSWKVLEDDDWCDTVDYRVDYCEVREVTLPGGRDLIAVDSGGNGGIEVEAWDRNEIRVRARIRLWDVDEDEAADAAKLIEIRTDDRIEPHGPSRRHGRHWAVSFRLMVPASSNLELETSNGGITVRGVAGDLRLHTSNGGLALEDAGGDVRGRTTNGGIHVVLNGKSWSGDGLDLRTTNGGIDLEMPRGYSADLDTRTVNGRFRSDAVLVSDRFDRKQFRGMVGDGGALIRLETTNGGIRLRER